MDNRRLIGLRGTYGVTQSELASFIGIATPSYCRKEQGKLQFKQGEMMSIYRFFRKYNSGITLDDIFLPLKFTKRKQIGKENEGGTN